MANYSQPPYGLPFAPPPQHFYPQQAPVGPVDGQPPPMPDPLQYPGLNLQQFAQNNQQPQYPFWPPPPATPNASAYPNMPFPPPFMAQNGVIPPPPVPPLNFPFSPMPQLPFQNAAAPTPPPVPPIAPFQQTQPHAALANGRVSEVVDSDKEEGEVSDGSRTSQPPAVKGQGELKPEPPRSVPSFNSQGGEESAPRTNDPGTSTSVMSSQHHPAPQVASAISHRSQQIAPVADMLPKQRAAAADFVKLLHDNSVGYPVLASEGLDVQLLEGLYRGLNLPIHPAPAAKFPDRPTISPPNTINPLPPRPASPPTAVKTNIAPAQLVKTAPSPIEPAQPKDRGSYVAALAAARARNAAIAAASKGASPTAVPAPAKPTPYQAVSSPAPTAKVPPVQPTATPPSTNANNGRPVESDAEKARKTELLRQKLEAFKARQASKKQESASGPATPSALPNPEALQAINAQAGQPTQGTQAPQTPTFSGIPGLFLGTHASNGTFQTHVVQTPPPQTASNPLKRPAATDFDGASTPRGHGPIYTRPLGQSPHGHDEESMIIEVSDDDSDEQDMDIDDDEGPSDQQRAASPPTSGLYGKTQISMLPEVSSRSASAFPFTSGVNSPGIEAQTALAYKQLEQTENEIARLKREIELKKKLGGKLGAIKKPAPTTSQAGRPNQNQAPSSSTGRILHLQEAQSVSGGSQDIRTPHRSEIEVELASLEAKLEGEKAKEIELEQQVAAVKAAQSQYLQHKAFLLKQLEALQMGLEPEPNQTELQQTERHLGEQQRVDELPTYAHHAMVNDDETINPHEASVEKPSPVHVINVNGDIMRTSSNAAHAVMPSASLPGIAAPVSEPVGPTQAIEHTFPNTGRVSENAAAAASDLKTSIDEAHPSEVSSKVISSAAAVTPTADDEDFYSPEPEMVPILEQPAEVQDASAAPEPHSEEGEVEMSESPQSEEDEYEPSEPPMTTAPAPVPDDDAMEIADSPAPSSEPRTTDDEEEAYEPPDVAGEATNAPTDPASIVPISDVQVVPVDETDVMDMSMSSENSDADDSSSEDSDAAFISSSNAKNDSVGLADDLAPRRQPQTVPAEPTVSAEQASAADDASTAFVPYESPLRMFKSYRYHKDFANEVPGSFQSMTYSHQIDPNKPLCRFEAVGGTCNDPQCDGQHFRGMGITGEKILVQLGTANPGKTAEERQQWNDGLRLVLKELRLKNIKDPNGIADEISKYRRKFLNDDTRVVNL